MNNNAEICEFIHHLFGTQDFVPLSAPKFIGNEKKYLNECIDTTFVSSVGAFVDRFEHDMALYYIFAASVLGEVDGRTVIAMAENLGIVLQVRNRDDVRHVINSLRLYYTRIYRQIQPEILGNSIYDAGRLSRNEEGRP